MSPRRWTGAALKKETSAGNATAYSASQQLIISAWNVVFAVILVSWVFGWSGGKDLVKASYQEAKVKSREIREKCRARRTSPRASLKDVAVGFDQYHEPPDELPAETRTFARLCASLTEEAEAIGWYEQRLAIEPDDAATAIMRDAQGEEFKHFCMDLEFLLPQDPPVARDSAGNPLPGGGHRRARRGGRGGGDRGPGREGRSTRGQRVTRHRRIARGRAMSHLLREKAPITASGWALLDSEARERLEPALGARKLVDFSGPHGWQHSAANLGRVEKLSGVPAKVSTPASGEPSGWSS